MKRIVVLAIVLVSIIVTSFGCVMADYYVVHEGNVCSYNPQTYGDDSVTFDNCRTFNAHAIMVWDKCSLEFKRNAFLISDNVTYSLIHKTDRELLLMPSNMAGEFNKKVKNKGCCCK